MLPTSLRQAVVVAMIASLCSAPVHAANNAAQMQQQMMQRMMQQRQQMIQQAQQQQQQMMRMIQQAQRQAQLMMRQQQRAAQVVNRTMSRQAQQMARVARSMPRPVLQNVIAEYEIIIADDGLVRSMSVLSPEIDEKGRPKKLDAEEKLKLKGDSLEERKLTGYKAGVEDLQPGDEVIVTLSRYRPMKKTSPGKDAETEKEPAKDKDKDAKKDKDAEKEKAKADDTEKSKSKEKEGDADENDNAHKLAHLKDWKPQGKLHGVIVETDMSGSRRMVLAIQGQKVVMSTPNNRNNNNQANAKAPQTSIDPSVMQGTFVLIVKHGQGGTGGTSTGGTGFGGFGK